jgi:hypothetical protein
MSILNTKLPPVLTKIILVFSLVGMLIGVAISYFNSFDIALASFVIIFIGLAFGVGTKFFVVKWMYFWMETKLAAAQKEKEEAQKLEAENREQRRRLAAEDATKHEAILETARKAAQASQKAANSMF